jgi:hypothetical protein
MHTDLSIDLASTYKTYHSENPLFSEDADACKMVHYRCRMIKLFGVVWRTCGGIDAN